MTHNNDTHDHGWLRVSTELMQANFSETQVVGDDMFCTNPIRIKKGIAEKAANAILLKVNQIGTVTESIEVPFTSCKSLGLTALLTNSVQAGYVI